MRKPATIIALVCGIAISLCMASISSGKIVARWHSTSYDAKFTANGCGSAFEATRTFSSAVKHLKLRQPAVGVSVLDPQGDRAAKVSSVKVTHLSGGGWKVVWKATPGLVCPPPVPAEPEDPPPPPSRFDCDFLTEGILRWEACQKERDEALRRWEEENAARKKAWEEEVAAQRQAKKEYRATWGMGGSSVKSRGVHFAYKFFTRKNVVPHPYHPSNPKPCLLICEAEDALSRTLREHYEMAPSGASCNQLTSRKVHCYFSGLTRADVRSGNIAGHKGEAYVTKSPYGFDVQIVSFYPA